VNAQTSGVAFVATETNHRAVPLGFFHQLSIAIADFRESSAHVGGVLPHGPVLFLEVSQVVDRSHAGMLHPNESPGTDLKNMMTGMSPTPFLHVVTAGSLR
jgi:hypothetical protein